MKKCLAAVLFLALMLTGCIGLMPDGPEALEGDGITLKTGFYGTLFPYEFEFEGASFDIDGITLNKIAHDKFDLYHASVGSYSEGTVYCASEDYESALAFYGDDDNYSYYCTLGVDSYTQSTETFEIANVDKDKFCALLDFADMSGYDPFDEEHNSEIEKVELPMPDDTKDTRMVFYKESKDGLFVSSQGTDYYIFDGQMYAVYWYDHGHGEYEKLVAVKVPEDLSEYFVEFMKPYL